MRLSTIPALTFSAFALALCACSSTATGPLPSGEFTLLDRAVWSGGTIRIASEDFRTFGDDAVLVVGTDSLPLRRMDATTLSATLPAMLSQVLSPRIVFGGYAFPLPAISVAGFLSASVHELGGVLPNLYPHAAIVDGHAYLIGNTSVSSFGGNLGAYDADTDTPVAFDPVIPNPKLRIPGMSYQPGVWVVLNGDSPESWRLDGGPVKLTDHPELYLFGSYNVVARFAENIWFTSGQHRIYIYRRANADSAFGIPVEIQAEQVHTAYLSPDGTRATVQVNRVLDGIPVFDMQTGDVAYRTPFESSQGARFSDDGSELAIVGTLSGYQPDFPLGDSSVVKVFRSSDGQELASRVLDYPAWAVSFDALDRWVFVDQVIPRGEEMVPSLLVLNRSDLSTVAELVPPADAPNCRSCYGAAISAGPNHVVIYSTGTAWRFTTPAPP